MHRKADLFDLFHLHPTYPPHKTTLLWKCFISTQTPPPPSTPFLYVNKFVHNLYYNH